ncbi:YibE/F family protein, partial [bacterium]|nr:YibE/F family protein [bacterium]
MKYFLVTLLFSFLPFCALAENFELEFKDEFFKARVIEVLEERTMELPDGTKAEQQKLKIKAGEGKFFGQEMIFNGIGDYSVLGGALYKVGDKVMAVASYDDSGEFFIYITGFDRTNALIILLAIFLSTLFIIGRFKGLRSIISLVASFAVMIYYIIPRIIGGANALFTTLVGSLLILIMIVYLTEGFKKRSHLAVASITISLGLTVFLSELFIGLAKLTGITSEEVAYLATIGATTVNFKGLVLAGIIIGALGVLDDVVISQITTVEQLAGADNNISKRELFKRAYKVGVSHISSMTNTLFLAYAGASLPLLILFVSGQSVFTGWLQVINNEAIATEIVRTIVGSIGLILSVPIATYLAVNAFSKKH